MFINLGCAELGFPCTVNCKKGNEKVLPPKKEGEPIIKPIQTPTDTSTPSMGDYFTITNNLSEDYRVEIRKRNSYQAVRLSSGQCAKIHKTLHKESITVLFYTNEGIYEICRPDTDKKSYERNFYKDSDGVYYCDHAYGLGSDVAANYTMESTDNLTINTRAVPDQCDATLK